MVTNPPIDREPRWNTFPATVLGARPPLMPNELMSNSVHAGCAVLLDDSNTHL